MDFVGGRSALSRREEDEIREEVDAEFESEHRDSKKKGKNRRPANVEDDDLGSLFGDGISGKLPKFANKITLKVYKNQVLVSMYQMHIWGAPRKFDILSSSSSSSSSFIILASSH